MNTAVALPTYIEEKVSQAIVPIKYDVAVKALMACRNIDDAKYFADQSEALAAWAKIYTDETAKIEAKRLKLHAYRRMGILARELKLKQGGAKLGTTLGAVGLSSAQIGVASCLAKIPNKKFKKAMTVLPVPAMSSFTLKLRGTTDGWKALSGHAVGSSSSNSITAFRVFTRKFEPKTLAKSLAPDEAKRARDIAVELIEWLDTFEQYLLTDAQHDKPQAR